MLWFYVVIKDMLWVSHLFNVFLDTNSSKSKNSRLKAIPHIKLSSGRGAALQVGEGLLNRLTNATRKTL